MYDDTGLWGPDAFAEAMDNQVVPAPFYLVQALQDAMRSQGLTPELMKLINLPAPHLVQRGQHVLLPQFTLAGWGQLVHALGVAAEVTDQQQHPYDEALRCLESFASRLEWFDRHYAPQQVSGVLWGDVADTTAVHLASVGVAPGPNGYTADYLHRVLQLRGYLVTVNSLALLDKDNPDSGYSRVMVTRRGGPGPIESTASTLGQALGMALAEACQQERSGQPAAPDDVPQVGAPAPPINPGTLPRPQRMEMDASSTAVGEIVLPEDVEMELQAYVAGAEIDPATRYDMRRMIFNMLQQGVHPTDAVQAAITAYEIADESEDDDEPTLRPDSGEGDVLPGIDPVE